ncbi:sterol carrier family protein [Zhihengliuella halotolerans]|uniref:sterol carrier family protein n=1 Tax=Zhihengliuella halotolerans TaxID=370736 RepID=UPI000C80D569|nr:sterol carrier family protein [Zhihengliuella halotolerans]
MGVRRRIAPEPGSDAVRAWLRALDADTEASAETVLAAADAVVLDRKTLATAVRYALEELSEAAEGDSVEVRVPPFGVAQCIAGPRHTRGTPPNVVEMPAGIWLAMATGRLGWDDAKQSGKVSASGIRADLAGVLPLF